MKRLANNPFFAISAMLLVTSTQAATIPGNIADADAGSGGTVTDVNDEVMYASTYYGLTPVFVFQLPTLSLGESFSAVTLHVTKLLFGGGTATGNLVGINRIGELATVLDTDFFGPGTTLQSDFLTPATPNGAVVSSDISSWLNTQYNGGANAGKFVFLSVGLSGNIGLESFSYSFASANHVTAGNRPFIDYAVVPEPSALALVGFGMLGLLRRRR